MSARFVTFWHSVEHDVVVNVDHVVTAEVGMREGRTRLFLVPNGGDDYLDVIGSLEDVRAILNGEARHVCGQLHPDVTDVRAMPVAHPNARPWQYLDIQKGGDDA